jgi:PAS domain S-box-containing protein
MPNTQGDAGDDLRVRAYIVDKLKLMHQRLEGLPGGPDQPGAPEGPPEADPGGPLMDQLPFAVLATDLTGRFVYVNRVTEELSGFPREELIGKLYFETEMIRFRDLIRIAAFRGLGRREPKIRPFRVTVRRKDGEQFAVEVTVRLARIAGGQRILCTARPVEERVRGAGPAPEERRAPVAWGLPISLCGTCKRVQDIDADWIPLEYFLYKRLELEFSHDTCPDCMSRRHRGEFSRSG